MTKYQNTRRDPKGPLTMSPAVIRKAGLEAVAKKLGPLGMVRFLQQFETGRGEYTKERDQWLKDMIYRRSYPK